MDEKGYTITYIPWEDMKGCPKVAARFKTKQEKDDFINKIYQPDSGWTNEELGTLDVIDDYNYILPF